MVIADGIGGENGSLEKLWRAARHLHRQSRCPDDMPPLFLFTDDLRLPDPVSVAMRLPAGAGILFRHYDAPDRKSLGRKLRAVARERRLVFVVAGNGALARDLGADGLHMPEGRMSELRRWRAGFRLLTAACHSEQALTRAARAGAHGVFLSPVFPTASHPETDGLGPLRFARLAHAAALPVYALGGVDAQTAQRLAGTGACGIAAIGALAAMK